MRPLKLSVIGFLLIAAFTTAKGQTADDVINKHIAATGGVENWKKINSIKMTGNINAGGTKIPINTTTVNGKGMRVDFSFNGMKGYQIVTAKEGWAYNPMSGQTKPEAMTADAVKQSQDQLDVQGNLIDYKQKGSKAEYLGKDDVEGTECYKVKLTNKEGVEETMFFDASNYYMIKSTVKTKVDGKETEEITLLSNYQKQPEGIVLPMSINSSNGEIAITAVEINKPIDEAIFKPGN